MLKVIQIFYSHKFSNVSGFTKTFPKSTRTEIHFITTQVVKATLMHYKLRIWLWMARSAFTDGLLQGIQAMKMHYGHIVTPKDSKEYQVVCNDRLNLSCGLWHTMYV